MAEKLIMVRACRDLEYHPMNRPDLTKLYRGPVKGMKGELIREGDILEVEESQFSDYDKIINGKHRTIRGSMKRLDPEPEASKVAVTVPPVIEEHAKRGPGRPRKNQEDEI